MSGSFSIRPQRKLPLSSRSSKIFICFALSFSVIVCSIYPFSYFVNRYIGNIFLTNQIFLRRRKDPLFNRTGSVIK